MWPSAGRAALKGSSGGQGKPAQPGRRLRWVPGEVQRVVVVARPEAVLLAEAKEDYTRNLAAISHLRRQHALERLRDVGDGPGCIVSI